MTLSNILKPPFLRVWGKPKFLGVFFFGDRTRYLLFTFGIYGNEIQEINMPSIHMP